MNPQDILGMINRVGDPPNRPQQRNNSNLEDPIFNVICTIAGGVLGGPAGMAIGGLAGTALSTLFSPSPNRRQRQSNSNPRQMTRSALSDIIENQMNDAQRRKLAQMVRQILRENPGNNGAGNMRNERNYLDTENMSNTLINQVLSVAQNAGQNSRSSGSSSSRFNERQRLGSQSSSKRSGCGGGCGCSRRSSCS